MVRNTASVFVVLLSLSVIGCGERGPATYPVSGIVTLDGTPVEGATVTFNPATGEGRTATATTDASGRYELSTLARGDGAMEGTYRVTIAKYEYPQGQAPAAAADATRELTEEEFEELYEEPVGEDAASRNVLPEKFANPATSGFEVQVTSGENSHDFAL